MPPTDVVNKQRTNCERKTLEMQTVFAGMNTKHTMWKLEMNRARIINQLQIRELEFYSRVLQHCNLYFYSKIVFGHRKVVVTSGTEVGEQRIWGCEKVITDPFEECGGTTHLLRLSWSLDGIYLVSAHAMNGGMSIN